MELNYQNVFERYEKKYMLDSQQYEELTSFLESHSEPDKYYKYTLGNVYCDTWDFRLIRNSLEKPAYKEKLRIRSYGVPQEGEKVFIEIKKKYGGIVYKRRTAADEASALNFIMSGHGEVKSQIDRELEWFINFYKPEPKVYISYDRAAFHGLEERGLRITFDTNIRWRDKDLRLSAGTWGEPLLDKGIYLMEIKIPDAMPLWLTKKLTEMKLFQTSFSKYGTVYASRLINNVKTGELRYA